MIPSLIPNPLFDYHQLFNLLLPVASLLVAIGLLLNLQRKTALPEQLEGLVQVVAVVALLANFDLAVQTTKGCVQQMVEEGLNARPEELPQKFVQKLMAGDEADSEDGLWNQVTQLGTHLFHALLAAFITLFALIALVMFFLAYLAQELALELGVGLAPLFVGFLLLPGTRSIGAQFLLYMLAIALFPLGWGAASLVSDRLIDFATSQDLGATQTTLGALSFALRNLFGALLLAIWIILSTIFAPFALIRAVTTGVHLTADGARAALKVIRSRL